MEPNDTIILSEGFPWPPHFQFTGDRCPETHGAICEWDGTLLDAREKKILRFSEQTPSEREYLIAIKNKKEPPGSFSKGKAELLLRLYLVDKLQNAAEKLSYRGN